MTVYYWRERVDKAFSGRIAKMEIGRLNRTVIIGQMRGSASALADAGEVVAALPFGRELAEEARHGVLLVGIVSEGEGFAAG
jgi:hypothetical protein